MVAKMIGLEMITSDGVPTENGVPKGCLCIDKTNGGLYQNTGTSTTSTWTDIGSGVGASVSSAEITDGEIVNADINTSAAIAFSKLAALTAGQILVGSAGNVPTAVAMSGHVAISSTGATTIQNNVISSGMLQDASVTVRKRANSGSLTATADGTGAGAANVDSDFFEVTSGAATDQISLPAISNSNKGKPVMFYVGANGFELITPASSNATINGTDADGTNQADIPADSLIRCTPVSNTAWIMEIIGSTGTVAAAVIPDND